MSAEQTSGYLVANRQPERLHNEAGSGRYPLIWAKAISPGGVCDFDRALEHKQRGWVDAPEDAGGAKRGRVGSSLERLTLVPLKQAPHFVAGGFVSRLAGEANGAGADEVKAQIVIVGEAWQMMFDPLKGSHFVFVGV
jgi:hypothetical protein